MKRREFIGGAVACGLSLCSLAYTAADFAPERADGSTARSLAWLHGEIARARPAYDFNTVSNRDEMPVWRGKGNHLHDYGDLAQMLGVQVYGVEADQVLASIDFLKHDRRIDPKRIAVSGMSLGCFPIVYAAVASDDIAAAYEQGSAQGSRPHGRRFPRLVELRSVAAQLPSGGRPAVALPRVWHVDRLR